MTSDILRLFGRATRPSPIEIHDGYALVGLFNQRKLAEDPIVACAVIDLDFVEIVSAFRWVLTTQGYAKSTQSFYMHRLIALPEPGKIVDHIDRDKLNNRRQNLREATVRQNCRNAKKSAGVTGYRGVKVAYRAVDGTVRSWNATIRLRSDRGNGRQKNLGIFYCPVEAAMAYDAAALREHGEFAVLNFPRS